MIKPKVCAQSRVVVSELCVRVVVLSRVEYSSVVEQIVHTNVQLISKTIKRFALLLRANRTYSVTVDALHMVASLLRLVISNKKNRLQTKRAKELKELVPVLGHIPTLQRLQGNTSRAAAICACVILTRFCSMTTTCNAFERQTPEDE